METASSMSLLRPRTEVTPYLRQCSEAIIARADAGDGVGSGFKASPGSALDLK